MLIVCTHCQRHIRHSDAKCPFCGTAVSFQTSRYGLGLAVALTVVSTLGCSDDGDTPVAVYAAPPTGGATAQGGSGSTGGAAAQGGGTSHETTGTSVDGIGGMVTLYRAAPLPPGADS